MRPFPFLLRRVGILEPSELIRTSRKEVREPGVLRAEGMADPLPPRLVAPVPGAPRSEPERRRRVLNVVVAGLGLVGIAPLMAVIAVAIRITSPGPAIFRQRRVGIDRRRGEVGPIDERRKLDRGGRIFTMYKFRTMYHENGYPKQVRTLPDDPRITPVGRVLRAYRVDELPQLVNVLRGDMNLVGPRPEQPKIFSRLSQQFGEYRDRQQVLPGITGWAQVRLPYDRSDDDARKKVDLDLEYIEQRGLWTDVKIMLSTIKVLLFRRGSL